MRSGIHNWSVLVESLQQPVRSGRSIDFECVTAHGRAAETDGVIKVMVMFVMLERHSGFEWSSTVKCILDLLTERGAQCVCLLMENQLVSALQVSTVDYHE
jgi:hypothetical protein